MYAFWAAARSMMSTVFWYVSVMPMPDTPTHGPMVNLEFLPGAAPVRAPGHGRPVGEPEVVVVRAVGVARQGHRGPGQRQGEGEESSHWQCSEILPGKSFRNDLGNSS